VSSRAQPVVAIDGPAGAGKSTVARDVAKALGFVLVDTGAMYRAVALAAKEKGVAWDDAEALGALVADLDLAFVSGEDGAPRLMLGGVDRSADIRTPEISEGASQVSAHPPVRSGLLDAQRRLGEDGGVVLEGRDIGTVVFPDAEVKVFLTATAEARAGRRQKDLEGRGLPSDFGELLEAMKKRDARDSGRDVAPLKPADDALVLDSTQLSQAEVVQRIVALVAEKR